jgi:hypothetical protein
MFSVQLNFFPPCPVYWVGDDLNFFKNIQLIFYFLNTTTARCLVSSTNIFANIQINGKPADLTRTNGFNLYDSKKWKSLFPHENPYLTNPAGRSPFNILGTTTSSRRRRSQHNNSNINQQNASGTSQRISSAAMNAANLFSDKTSKFAFEAGEVVSKWESIQKSSLDYGVPVDADECIDIAQRIQVSKFKRTKKKS